MVRENNSDFSTPSRSAPDGVFGTPVEMTQRGKVDTTGAAIQAN